MREVLGLSKSTEVPELDFGRFVLPTDLPRSLSSAQLSRVVVRERVREERPPIMEVKDLPNEPEFLEWWSGDLRGPVRSAAFAMRWEACWSRS